MVVTLPTEDRVLAAPRRAAVAKRRPEADPRWSPRRARPVVRKKLVRPGQTRGRTGGAVRRGLPWLGLCTILGADGANWSMSNRLRQAADRERRDRAPCMDARRCNELPKFAESTLI